MVQYPANGIDPTKTVKTYDFSYFFNNGYSKGDGVDEIFEDFTIPKLDGVNLQGFFASNKILEKVPKFDTSNATSLSSTFGSCNNLNQLPKKMNTSKCTNFSGMFSGCGVLTSIPTLDLSLATSNSNLSNMFYNCSKLENITFTGSVNANLSFPSSPLLTFESVKSILTAASNTTNTNSKTLTFNRSISDVDGELAALVATCTSKGWTISGLTLE